MGSSVQSVSAVQYEGLPVEVMVMVASSMELDGACCSKLYSYIPKDEEKEEDRYF